MSFNYENFLLQHLNSDKVVVLQEQLFAKNGELDPDKIYIITKMLTSTITYGAETQPYQLLILSQQDRLDETQKLLDEFTVKYNFFAEIIDGTFVKHQYSSPVVMSNFNEAAYGYRSVLYVSATLVIMENVIDIENLQIDNINIKPLLFALQYSMSGNTQPINKENIASTVKSISTFSCSLQLPAMKNISNITEKHEIENLTSNGVYDTELTPTEKNVLKATITNGTITNINQENGTITFTVNEGKTATLIYWLENNLVQNMLKISSGNLSGNTSFNIKYKVCDVDFNYNCKLINLQMQTQPADIPTLQVGFQR